MLPRVAHWFAAMRAAARTRKAADFFAQKFAEAYDRAVAWAVEPCDVLIGMSGMCNRVAAAVKRKYGAKVWIERGSRHILSQKAILAAIPGAEQVPDFAVTRELIDYNQADVVSVLSRHCEDSFLEYGYPAGKLVRNPLGVDLDAFKPTLTPPADPPTVLMTGTWSLRKGCDTLTAAWRQMPGVRLVHVGPVADCPFPDHPTAVHHDKVDQSELRRHYAAAQVFALASREEGLALVQPQALACGLRLVCTGRTGGEDLKAFVSDPAVIRVVPPDDPVRLAVALRESLSEAAGETGIRDRLGPVGRTNLSWAAYGRRYSHALHGRV
jgi:glycosyltransferase involved in cell wall biosynthesis